MKLLILLPTMLLLVFNVFAQQYEVPIVYEINLAPNFSEEKPTHLTDKISLVKAETEMQQAQDEFYKLEKNYLAGIKYGLKYLDRYNEIFDRYNMEGITFKFPKEEQPKYLYKKKDTLFYNYHISDQRALFKDQVITMEQVGQYDEWGEMFETKDVVNLTPIHKSIVSITFSERWNITANGKFSKHLDAYSLGYPATDDYGNFMGAIRLPDVLLNKDLETKNLFKTVEYNVIFHDHRIEHIDEYFTNGYYKNIFPNDRKKLINPIMKGVLNGEIDIYHPSNYDNGKPIKVIHDTTKTELTSMREELWLFDPETGDEYPEIVTNYYHSKDIIGFRFLEEWYLSEKGNGFAKKVKYYAPIIYKRSLETGEVMGHQILFWIKND